MLLKLVPRLSDSGFDSAVISLAAPGPLSGEFERIGVRLHHLGVPPGRISLPALARLVGLLKREKPDLVQGWMYHGNLAAQLARFFVPNCPPVAWSIRGAHTDLSQEKELTALTIWLGARLSAYPAAIIYNSQASAQEHWRRLEYKRERAVVIPNGFDAAAFAPSPQTRLRVRSDLGVPEQSVLVGLVARFHPVKDHATFLRALAQVHRRHPEVHGVLIGSGTDAESTDLKALIVRTGTNEFVRCVGERTDMAELTVALDIACNTSVSEGFPNAVGEAMACGVPCVVTDVGDSAWIVGDTGRVAPPGLPQAFAAALSELVEIGPTGRSALGARARQRIVESFSLDAVARRYAQTYEALIARKSA